MPPFLGNTSHLVQTVIGPVAAATASTTFPVLTALSGQPLLVKRVSITPGAGVTGANSNTKHINVLDNSTELTSLELVLGTDLTTLTDRELYAPTSPRTLDAGDVLSVQVEQVGSGLAIPPLLVTVEYATK